MDARPHDRAETPGADVPALPEPGFSINFGRRPKMLTLVRRFVEDFYAKLYDEIVPPVAQRAGWPGQVALAANELAENVVRHGVEGDAVFSVSVRPDPQQPDRAHTVAVKTRNRASAAQRRFVQRRLHDLGHVDDLFEYYVGLMTETATRMEGSGLGLARIRVEAQMELDCRVEGETLEIIAQAHVRHRTG